MKRLLSEFRAALMSTLVLAVVCCGAYPLVVFGISQVLFHDKANGSLIVDKDGTIHGSHLIGQQFTLDKYFITRPSDAGANGMAYDPTASGGSNLGGGYAILRRGILRVGKCDGKWNRLAADDLR